MPAHARANAAAGVGAADPHIRREICTSERSYYHSHQEYRKILVVRTHAARRHTHTRTHTATHTHAHPRTHTHEASIRIYVYVQRGKGLCVCALDIDKLGCRGSSMALENRSVSVGDPSTYTLIYIATCARARARARASAAPPRAQRPRMRRRPTERSPPWCAPGRKRRIRWTSP